MSHNCYGSNVTPFTIDSTYCDHCGTVLCNPDNLQPITGSHAPLPEPEPEPAPEPVSPELLRTIYHNATGVLTLVFDRPVIAGNTDRMELILDIQSYLADGSGHDLGDSDIHTVDDKRQSVVLALSLPAVLRDMAAESLQESSDMALVIRQNAVYDADDFTGVGEVLVPDIMIVR